MNSPPSQDSSALVSLQKERPFLSKLSRCIAYALAWSGPGSFLYTLHWFDKTIRAGSAVPDSIHTVLVTNHDGLYRYITAAQNTQYERLIGATAVLMVIFFAMCYWEKRRRENLSP